MELLAAVFAGVAGLLIGGVINILSDDLPLRRPLGLPHYPDGAPRPRSAWLGILAFVSGQRLSPGMPAAEIVTPADDEGQKQGAASSAPTENLGETAIQDASSSSAPVENFGEMAIQDIASSGIIEIMLDPPLLVGVEAESAAANIQDTASSAPAVSNVPAPMPTPRPPARLGWRHPIVEIVNALAFAGLVFAFPDEKNLWAWLIYAAIMLLITVIDVEHRLILFVVIIPSCLFALLVAIVSPPQDRAFSEFLVGGAVGFGLFFAMYLGGGVFTAVSRHDEVAFGFGDVMLATLSGLMLGWRAFIFASLITVFAGAAGALIYISARMMIRRRYRWFTPLPYGPYIVFGTLLMLFFRETIGDLLKSSIY
ncbi:MAG: prepilin peptidase [Chloroflexi bacterium]|nr:prepilin peptidase [Chloroflexota bacterium]